MTDRIDIAAVAAAGLLLLSGCRAPVGTEASRPEPEQPAPALSAAPPGPEGGDETEPSPVEEEAPPEGEPDYIETLVRETVAQFAEPGMSEYELAKAAFDYMIETVHLVDPVGLDLWKIRGGYREPPSYVENRSLSVLLFHVGKCEDYAAALTLLLRGAGLESEYVPGLTYSTQGELVDHAWVVVKIEDVWYHLDCQLEQNISRHGSIRYKYFLRGDATMVQSHRWGQNLVNARLLREEQNEELLRYYLPEECPQDYPTPPRRDYTQSEKPDVEAIRAAVAAEFREYEEKNGPLPHMESDIIPPVFALEGYGPQD